MKQKIFFLLTIALVLLSVGVLAERTLTNLQGITVPIGSVVAGNTFEVNFSYMYLSNNSDNVENSPLILNLSLVSDNSSYPVWKNDFKVNGIIKRAYLIFGIPIIFGSFYNEYPFNCSEETNQTIVYPVGTEDVVAPNGTFYCYTTDGDLKLDKGDNVFLNITSNYALYPGQYNLTAKLYYLNDTYPPFVNITNKNDFEKYYMALDNIEVFANITDVDLNPNSIQGIIFTPTQNISLDGASLGSDGLYHLSRSLPDKNNLPEGNYNLTVYAKDTSGNVGNDSVILKIDNTGPIIKVLQPINNSIVSDMLTIELNVTDSKSGVNKTSVYYELAEVINGNICPDTGIGLNATCPNTHYLNLPYNSTFGTYYKEINTTAMNLTSGSYWLYAKASDNLGNEGVL